MRKLPKDTENVVISKLLYNCSTRSIAQELRISQSCLQRIRQEQLPGLEHPRGSRPKVLTCTQESACVRAVTSGGHDNVVAVARDFRKEFGVNVSDWTIRRALRRAGLSARVKQKKPKLTPKHIRDRLDFAKKHQNWTVNDWERVIFSNESKINHFNSDGRSWCWFRDGQLSSRVQETVKHGGGSIMVWACMTIQGCGLLIKITGKVNQFLYKEIFGGWSLFHHLL
jgi:transposase